MNKIKLIITGDDFCYNKERDEGMLECLQKAAITRTSMMVNAVNSTKSYISNFLHIIKDCIGLHFNITEGQPICEANLLTSIVDDEGRFFKKEHFLKMCQLGKINSDEVKKELILQLNKFKELTGVLPFYIDGHQHVHVFPIIRNVVSEVMREYGVKETRIPFEEISSNTTLTEFLSCVNIEAKEAAICYESQGIKFSAFFIGLSLMGRGMSEDKLKELLKNIASEQNLKPVTVELMCHPGNQCLEPSMGGCGDGADDFAQSSDRLHELQVLSAISLTEFYKDFGVERVKSCFL